jgi:FkbM family methyltransferase
VTSSPSTVNLSEILQNAGFKFMEDGLIHIPDNFQRIKIDVGLSLDAPNAISWLKSDPHLLVLGFEANPKCIESVRETIRQLSMGDELTKRLWLIPIALGAKTQTREFFETVNPGWSSFYKPRKYDILGSYSIPMAALSDVLDLVKFPSSIKRIDHIKTDCQGGDLDVIRGAVRDLNRIAVVTSESESTQYSSAPNSEGDMRRLLESFGFVQHNPRSIVRRFIGNLILNSPIHSMVALLIRTIRERTGSKLLTTNERTGASINVEDPTFINLSYSRLVEEGVITAFQKG